VVQQCVAAGLVGRQQDPCRRQLSGANASLRSVKPLDPDLVKAIERTAKEQVQKLHEQDDDQDPPCAGGGSAGSGVGHYAKPIASFVVRPIRMQRWYARAV
jgi:hypothetical protein